MNAVVDDAEMNSARAAVASVAMQNGVFVHAGAPKVTVQAVAPVAVISPAELRDPEVTVPVPQDATVGAAVPVLT